MKALFSGEFIYLVWDRGPLNVLMGKYFRLAVPQNTKAVLKWSKEIYMNLK